MIAPGAVAAIAAERDAQASSEGTTRAAGEARGGPTAVTTLVEPADHRRS
jgi:hypothetical protein